MTDKPKPSDVTQRIDIVGAGGEVETIRLSSATIASIRAAHAAGRDIKAQNGDPESDEAFVLHTKQLPAQGLKFKEIVGGLLTAVAIIGAVWGASERIIIPLTQVQDKVSEIPSIRMDVTQLKHVTEENRDAIAALTNQLNVSGIDRLTGSMFIDVQQELEKRNKTSVWLKSWEIREIQQRHPPYNNQP